jgi:hypothetical protein
VVVGALFGWLSSLAFAQGDLAAPEASLTLKLPAIEKATLAQPKDPDLVRHLVGQLDGKRIELFVWVLPIEKLGLSEPSELVDDRQKQLSEGDRSLDFSEREELSGSYGALTYADYALGEISRGGAAKSTFATLAYMTDKAACSIEITVEPPASQDDVAALRKSLKQGVLVAGKPRDPRWSDAEVNARWERDVPPKARKDPLKPPDRTAHYLIMTNSAGGALFAKKMEENYEKIRAVFPFPERKGRRLMPVFLFRSKEDYLAFCEQMHAGGPGSKGHAYKDYYATWYESPNDPVHIHEATHQIFRNRLGLSGGGSWFQEGLAEYMCTKKDERNVLAQNVAKGKAKHLQEFVKIPRLLTGDQTEAHDNYLEAALLIEFLRESKETKAKFGDFVQKVGAAPRNSPSELDKALHDALGMSVDELDKAFTTYCIKR